ncbi:hypothetical protein ARMGADRAFT_1031227 [Armillaria gallica]|uniref:Uncharacterized protein n=1 Tax=Armillaria gallica TaxID=47427 RepID=A0A2H3DLK4_ARMGA|nr:hypothetical protein ARMGADRAFT_1031227 [Armillaria gallica]
MTLQKTAEMPSAMDKRAMISDRVPVTGEVAGEGSSSYVLINATNAKAWQRGVIQLSSVSAIIFVLIPPYQHNLAKGNQKQDVLPGSAVEDPDSNEVTKQITIHQYISFISFREQALGSNEDVLPKAPLLGRGLEPVIHPLPPKPEVPY